MGRLMRMVFVTTWVMTQLPVEEELAQLQVQKRGRGA